jgi:DNA-binding transcriptional LysR family regulator
MLTCRNGIPFAVRYNLLFRNKIAELESEMSEIADLRVFVRVVERGGFSAASEGLGITPSAVSKLITRLEERLGVRLLHRTTRRLAMTPEGETFHLRARDILAAIDDAEAEVSRAGQRPRGRLRVNCVTAFALHQLMPTLPDFLGRYPEVDLELALTDRVVDLMVESADVGIRTGPIEDASLVARKIAEIRRGLYASPEYLERRGSPLTPEQLRDHDCIVLSVVPSPHRWLFNDSNGRVRGIDVTSRILVDSGEAALRLAVAGGGIARVADVLVSEAIRAGALKAIMAESHVAEAIPLSAVYPQGRHRMPKVRAFLEFLVERFGHAPWR